LRLIIAVAVAVTVNHRVGPTGTRVYGQAWGYGLRVLDNDPLY